LFLLPFSVSVSDNPTKVQPFRLEVSAVALEHVPHIEASPASWLPRSR
jgi:hypothetical protein